MSVLDDDKTVIQDTLYHVEHPYENEIKQWMKNNLANLQKGKDFEIVYIPKGILTKEYDGIKVDYKWPAIINVKNKDVVLVGYTQEELPEYIQFGEIIGGSFICSHSKFASMKGFPKIVGKIFDCSFCANLKSLDNSPCIVDIDYCAVGTCFSEKLIRQYCKVTHKIYCNYTMKKSKRQRAIIDTTGVGKRRHDLYANVLNKINQAVNEGFYLEAVTLLESIISDRLESICNEHNENNDNAFKNLGTLIISSRTFVLSKTWLDVINRLDKWRDKRNRVLHEMAKMEEGDLSTFEERYNNCKSHAETGKKLLKEIDNEIRKYRKRNKIIQKD
jgi:hypothetical protein